MKKSLLLSVCLLAINSVFAQDSVRLSEPVQQTDKFEVFGEVLDIDSLSEPVTLKQIVTQKENTVTLKTQVKEVCAKKGCFFIAQDGEVTARITFKDYGFFIPTDSKGKEVVLIGDFSVVTLSEEQARHYAEDAGEDADKINGEQKEYSIIATSVIIPKD